MKFFKISLLIMIAISSLKAQKSGLTFFSQEGELFYVILDGIRQNNTAAANVKVTDLDRPNYRAKIVFDNAELKDINKNLFVQDVDGKSFHTVYMIYKNKKGEMDLKMSSFNEAKDVAPSTKENVVKYHDKEIPNENTTSSKTVNQSTANESVNINMGVTGAKVKVNEESESVNIGISLDGMKDMMNMDGTSNSNIETTTTKTTTTTITTRNTNSQPKIDNSNEQPVSNTVSQKGCIFPMNSTDFEKGKSAIINQSFAESQMKTAKQMTKVNCLSVKQIRTIMDIFSFEDSKLEYAKFAYAFCIDKKNYFQLSEAFTFSSNADSLNEFLDSQQ